MPQNRAFEPLAVEARGLACVRGGREVFSGLSFRAAGGSLLAVRGPNGSGKSSLLRLIAGLLPPSAGSIRFEGVAEDAPVAHYLGHLDGLKPALSLYETLAFWAALYEGKGGIAEAAERVGLGHALDLPAGVLSAGQRRRAGLARLLVAPRPLWLLDEPASALDRDGEALLGDLIAEHIAVSGLVVVAIHQDLPRAADAVIDLAQAA